MSGYDGFGNFTRGYNWVADKLAAIKITASRMDGEFDIIATALNQVILRNGVAAMTGDFKAGGNKITGIGAGAVGAPSVAYSGDVTTGMWFPAAGVVAWSTGGVERARANSTGFNVPAGQKLGAGTNTPRTTLDVVGVASFRGAFEDVAISASALNGATNLDYTTAPVFMFTSNAAGNFTFNIRGDGATTLDSIMAVGQMLTLAVEVPQGGTAYYCTAITVDGNAPAQIIWQNGAPTVGNVSGTDIYLIRVVKTGAATFKVRASQSQER